MSGVAAAPVGVLVTRPEPEASALARELAARGYRPILSPMLRYAREERLGPEAFEGVGAVALTSAAAARALAEDFAGPAFADRGPPMLAAFAVGDKTAAAARAAGFDPVISAAGTARELAAALAADPPEGVLLLPRGRDMAADLPALLAGAGAGLSVRERIVYRAEAASTLGPDAAAAVAAGDVAAALAMSARTAEALGRALLGAAKPEPARRARMLCLSRSVAQPLLALAPPRMEDCPWEGVEWVETPTLAALLSLLEARFPPRKRIC